MTPPQLWPPPLDSVQSQFLIFIFPLKLFLSVSPSCLISLPFFSSFPPSFLLLFFLPPSLCLSPSLLLSPSLPSSPSSLYLSFTSFSFFSLSFSCLLEFSFSCLLLQCWWPQIVVYNFFPSHSRHSGWEILCLQLINRSDDSKPTPRAQISLE